MRDRITIRRTAPRQWTVRVPAFGFGRGETLQHATHGAAVRAADRLIHRVASNVVSAESVWQPTDAVGAVPAWSPLAQAGREGGGYAGG
ncbi:hypothetical protein [Actinosynnema mirum]|uniref:Uncharacterized protein n=1 Tax=Actinosynnema mirum (strain ATCC 29888 / DSM 43827 / JCM 3225 / NBRC 14064 / NCIMB 13271 / NRRL B-12336 / IMRU 3971 / 101) TaxID=446462 RepID=C6WC44_ACTMD|nr:hypothetical protein [Actinosynnema mirum]ACU39432.1 hypothetical protein Amir_5616 [Actinosynnema mirum DSM 43827]